MSELGKEVLRSLREANDFSKGNKSKAKVHMINKNDNEQQYLDLLQKVLKDGEQRGDRTGTGTLSLFGEKMEFDLQKGFPLLTTKKTWFHGIKGELLWFLRGDTNIKWLHQHNIHFWDEWADENGDLGPIYGKQLRDWKFVDVGKAVGYQQHIVQEHSIDQVERLIEGIESDPEGRRHVLTTWNAAEIALMNLPPCHGLVIQFYVRDGEFLDCQMYQRSADMFLGVPFNIASYSLLTHMVAQVTGYKAGKFTHILGDAHIYKNHVEQVKEQLSRDPFDAPELVLNPAIKDIDDFDMHEIGIKNYKSHSAIKAEVAV